MSTKRVKLFGFGYDPSETVNHFYVQMSEVPQPQMEIYERFNWDEGQQMIHASDILRLRLSRHKWDLVSKELTTEFNNRLRKDGKTNGKFLPAGTPLGRLFGKEMMVLLWGIVDADPSCIPVAIRNWRGFLPEERWWLYTMTNASTGSISDRKGWRMALKYILCENPVEEVKQPNLF